MSNDSVRERPLYYVFGDGDRSTSPSSPPVLTEVGGKALSLIESAASALPVPPGLVLTIDFFDPWLRDATALPEWADFVGAGKSAGRYLCDAVKTACAKTLVPTEGQRKVLDEALEKAFGAGDPGLVAVRSSSPEEDLVGSSFAGGYDTTLGVASDDLVAAIVASFVSMFDHRVVQYKLQHNMRVDAPRIAVVVQRQIASDVSGVAFSLNPANNCYDEAVISANFGLGESVVSGIVTPDSYVVDKSKEPPTIVSKKIGEKDEAIFLVAEDGGTQKVKNDNPSAQALTDDRVLEVAALVGRVGELRGGAPLDIEWAYCGDELFLLQARPITGYFPLLPEMITEPGKEKRLYTDLIVMSQGFSDPFSVLGLDLWHGMMRKAKPEMFGGEGKECLLWKIHGRQYINLSNFGKTIFGKKILKSFGDVDASLGRAIDSVDIDEYIPSSVPVGAKGFAWRATKNVSRMLPYMLKGFFKDADDSIKPYKEWSENMMELCQDSNFMKDESFGNVWEVLINKWDDSLPMIGSMLVGLISSTQVKKLFSGNKEAEDVIDSLFMDLEGNPTSEMGHAMLCLASFPELQEIQTSNVFVHKLEERTLSDDFMAAYSDYMKRYGCRGMKEIDIATPRTHENIKEFFKGLKKIDKQNNAINNVVERRDAAYQKLLAIATKARRQKSFVKHATRIKKLMGYREYPKYMYVVLVSSMRRRALSIGRKFVAQGRMECIEQIFDLTIDQITEAQTDPGIDLMAHVRESMSHYATMKHVKEYPLVFDSRGKIIRGKRKTAEGDEEGVLYGDPISCGTITGRAKILLNPYEKSLEYGEVLVTRFTEPSWTPIFINAAAVIMEVGGPLQHGAIIAREYGIPCVSGIENATSLINDGDLVEVCGTSGYAKIINHGQGTKQDSN